MIALFLIGLICIGFASYYLVSFYSAPVYSFKAGYSGFEIAHNTSSITPVTMTVLVSVNPPHLFFDYYFICNANGTYNFIFAFPFNILEQTGASEKMATRSRPHGSAIWLQYVVDNVSSWGLGHEIWGDFVIENTFQDGTRGSYTIILPFGMGMDFEVVRDLWQALKVPFNSGGVNITLYVALPVGFRPTTTFPLNRGLEYPPSHFNVTQAQASMTWDAGTLQNSVTIEAIDINEKSFYDNIPFTSGILLAIGLQFVFTIGYDFVKKWGRSQTEESY
ncbi:MAG: hypothetical protein ABSB28_07675 [Candidatus Bathyarchaeia archaeon]